MLVHQIAAGALYTMKTYGNERVTLGEWNLVQAKFGRECSLLPHESVAFVTIVLYIDQTLTAQEPWDSFSRGLV